MRPALSLLFISLVGSTLWGCSTLFPGDNPNKTTTTTANGCTATTKHIAPGGYYVNGNAVCTASGEPHLFHGVDRPSLEWSPLGENVSPADFALMASWHANVVRIALNQDFWIAQSPQYNPSYQATVDNAVHWAEDAGLDVILDLHWSDEGVLGSCNSATSPSGGCQQPMADTNSITFWTQVASIYKTDGRVLFELYNEPHDVPWPVWQMGGTAAGFKVAGMQQLYSTVRNAGADNLVVIGGLSWAADLSGVPANRIAGYNIMYATHPYNNMPAGTLPNLDTSWGFLTATDPVIVTEFGDGNSADCPSGMFTKAITTFDQAVINYADQHNASWTIWAWYPGNCQFPSIISDWSGTPTPIGTMTQTALANYTDPAPDGKRDGGTVLDAGSAKGDGGKPATDAGAASDGGTPQDAGTAG